MNLFRALSYKEWMKTRRHIQIALLLIVAVTVYSYIELTYSIRINEAVNVWYGFIYQGMSLSPFMMYILPLTGITLAVIQYVPEMINKRLKLTLHLPYSETYIVLSMLAYGLSVLILLYAFALILLVIVMSFIMPFEVIGMMIWQLLPWMIAGFCGYGFTAWICIEPQWKQRVSNIVVSVVILSIMFLSIYPGAYSGFTFGMIVLTAVSFVFPFYSCIRFKQGVQ